MSRSSHSPDESRATDDPSRDARKPASTWLKTVGQLFYLLPTRYRSFTLMWLAVATACAALALVTQWQMASSAHTQTLRAEAQQFAVIMNAESRSTIMGGATLLSVVMRDMKRLLVGAAPADDQALRTDLSRVLRQFEAEEAFVLSAGGVMVARVNRAGMAASAPAGKRPFWQLAMQGNANLYPVVVGAPQARGMYYAVPVRAVESVQSQPIGVFTLQTSAVRIDQLMARYKEPALLVSPDGLVFASNQLDWVLHLTAALSPAQRERLRASKQFGELFEVGDPALLPLNPADGLMRWDGRDYAVASHSLDWPDEVGPWRVVLMQDTAPWVPLWQRVGLAGGVAAAVLLLGFLAALRKRHEAEIRQMRDEAQDARRRLLEIADTLPLAVFQFEPDGDDGRYLFVSDKARDVIGVSSEDLYADSSARWRNVPSPEREESIAESIARRARRERLEFENPIVIGAERRWVLSRSVPTQLADGRWVWNGFWLDVTSERQQQLALSEARDQAEEATRAKSMFLANMSHEIRTPMNAIIGMSHLALRLALQPRERDYLQKIHDAGNALLGIIDAILDFSKIEAGQLDMETVEFDLDAVLDHVGTVTAAKAYDKNLVYLFDVPAEVPRALQGDPLRLGQVLINLVNNAIKFTERGEVHLSARNIGEADGKVELQFCVRDTGIGMTPEQAGRLFQPFMQADGSTTRKFGGTGLGLSISKALVDMMGGRIWVESTIGGGSRFQFTCWLGLGKRVPAQVSECLDGLRVLVVDDNPVTREILVEALHDLPVHVDAVASGEAALATLAACAEPYQLLMTDYQMPGMNGIDLASKVQAELDGPPRVVLITATGDEDVRSAAERAGVDAFLRAPLNRSMLVNTLVNLFARKHAPMAATRHESMPHFEGVAVLVVEDNAINQQIAVELLESTGIAVEVAASGKEALARLHEAGPRRYDLLFMDLQMPVMDGHEATRAIRAERRFDGLPIVAMTAHAMLEERERCLAEGMNDHISKPIDPGALYALLRRMLAGKLCEPAAVANSVAATTRGAAVSLEEFPGLDMAAARARLNGNQALLLKLLRRFRHNQANVPADIRAGLAAGDPAKVERLVHTLKGLAATLGAYHLEGKVGVLDSRITAGASPAEMEEALADMQAALEALMAALDAGLPADEASTTQVAAASP